MELEDFLEHHGIKGQRWGIRRDPKTGIRPIAKTLDKSRFGRAANANAQRSMKRSTARADKRFEKSAGSVDTFVKVNNRAADIYNSQHVDRINNKPQYKGKDFNDETLPLTKQYVNEHHQALVKSLEQAATELGTNASGTRKFSIALEPQDKWAWHVTTKDVKHANNSFVVEVKHDAQGRILGIEFVSPLTHSDLIDFLEHHGVKGMHWGIRNKRSRVKTGAARHPQSAESKKASELRKRKPHQLTSNQLKDVNARLNLEKNFRQLNPNIVDKGHSRVKAYLALYATAATIIGLSQTPTAKRVIRAGKNYIMGTDVQKTLVKSAKVSNKIVSKTGASIGFSS